jgi:hypothetical protein
MRMVALLSAASLAPVAVSTPAHAAPAPTAAGTDAGCRPPDGNYDLYSFSSVSNATLPSNLYSDYIVGPATITYNQTKTAQVNASMTATVSAEAGIVFAKASASLGVTVGASWSQASSWSYSKSVPAGRTARLRMYHNAKRFTVTKKHWYSTTCSYRVVHTSTVVAPVKPGSNTWNLENR